MSDRSLPNLHGTAIVVGTTGILFSGPPGSGKSSTALACIESAEQRGRFCALVADDQVLIEIAGGRVLAHAPQPIRGLLEVRTSGIARIRCLSAAQLHLAITLSERRHAERLPPDDEMFDFPGGVSLPCLRLSPGEAALARIAALVPGIVAV